MAGGLGDELGIAAQAVEPVQIEPGIGGVLIVHQPAYSLQRQEPRLAWEIGFDPCGQGAAGVGGGDDGPDVLILRFRLPLGGIESRGETAQIGLHCLAAGADRVLEGDAGEGQGAAAGQRAEQHRADHAARAFGDCVHVEADEALRALSGGRHDALGTGAAVAHRRLLGDGVDSVRGADQLGALRDEAPKDRAARFHQLRGKDDVDIPGDRRERQYRRSCAAGRDHLDIVDGGARPLGDAGNRGALRRMAAPLAELDDPVGKHAATLAAQAQHRDGDALAIRHQKLLAAIARAARRWSVPIAQPRRRWRKRSRRSGLAMIRAL